MVRICTSTYTETKESTYTPYFEKYAYPLHPFQKHSIEAIVDGHHILVTAPTGSGKTLPGEFAIEHFVAQGKKVIYTTPIKALSNQKFYDFSTKYPHISFGVLTGDLKNNPDAQCLIMTTEILLNKLYQVKSKEQVKQEQNQTTGTSFEMDIETELACVVFDEVHYINDANRGHVWEQSIMMLPPHIQMVMLSATIDQPEKFAAWCENRTNTKSELEKQVYIASNSKRAVPLTHYGFITTNQGIFKAIKDKTVQEEIRRTINKPIVLQTAEGQFQEQNYHTMQKTLQLFEKNKVVVKRSHVLNNLCTYLFQENMLPALCFVFSRKQLEICAKELTAILLEDDSKVPYIVRRECETIIRKFPNFQEYLDLAEYNELVALLEKGIGIHHAGILAPLREMVELLYAKGYIKMLFCTETLSIGINMPVKTTIFTDLTKFDGSQGRMLYAHEYTQAAGRAGRLGLDKVGHVIHLNNLFRNVDLTGYRTMMNGRPQRLVSKFKISYNMLLNLIDIGDTHLVGFAHRSMIQQEIDRELKQIQCDLDKNDEQIKEVQQRLTKYTNTSHDAVWDEYIALKKDVKTATNRTKREMEKRILDITKETKHIEEISREWKEYKERVEEREDLESEKEHVTQHLSNHVKIVLRILEEGGFIQHETDKDIYSLTELGEFACQCREVHCLVFSHMIHDPLQPLLEMTAKQWVALCSCFTNVSVIEEDRVLTPSIPTDPQLQKRVVSIHEKYQYWQTKEGENNINTGQEYEMHYELISYVLEWCDCETAGECRNLLQKLEKERGIFLGEFVKALLKINNIAQEMEKIAEKKGAISFLSELKKIPALTLKYVATNQSLYV